jgi:His-Xaa-Ser system radical SAM maturase HxsC
VIEPKAGFVRSLYRPAEKHHTLFATERCNSNCLMCSQPPKDRDDTIELTARNLRLIELMKPAPPYLTVTGGEPTLLGKHLFTLLHALKESLPETEIHMLTNGRTFAWGDYTRQLAEVGHDRFSVGVPLYSDFAGDHDYIVQAKGAFDQTMAGFHQLARNGIRSEVRVVLHKRTIPRLTKLAEYIYRNLTFVEHVALMGLEHIGYTPRNIAELWIDPYEYQGELEEAVEYLAQRGMTVSIYNHQLCLLRKSLWPYAQKSISDWKNLYLPECKKCSVLEQCGGLFKWAAKKHSEHIHPL